MNIEPNHAFLYERDTAVPMRDGTHLSASLYRPAEGTAPAILVRTPYGAATPMIGMAGNAASVPNATAFVDAGFAVIWVETRGTFKAEGDFRPQVDDIDDGFDTVEWLTSQPWSNGRVGMYGSSYLAMTQWAAAASGHPALQAIVPTVGTMRWYEGLWYHPGGAMSLSAVTSWHAGQALTRHMTGTGTGDVDTIGPLVAAMADPRSLNDHTPLAEHPILHGQCSFDEIVAHPDRDGFWEPRDFSDRIAEMTPPALVIAGWYDLFLGQQLRDFERYTESAGSETARRGTRLIVGPWDHDPTWTGHFSDHDFGMFASAVFAPDITGEHIRHFQRWLGESDAVQENPAPAVKLFVMGSDQWETFDAWPPAEALPLDLYLGGSADADAREGALSSERADAARTWGFAYDPADPVPTVGGAQIPAMWGFTGPTDQRALDDRPDILTFASAQLDVDTKIVGRVSATLFVRSDAVDTDFTAKLIDVHPDGRARPLCDGIQRMRYRKSLRHPEPMVPGEVYEITLDMAATANVFRAGHRIRVDVASGNFPRFDRNTNTGGAIAHERIEDAVIARNEVLSGPDHPSRITVSLVPND